MELYNINKVYMAYTAAINERWSLLDLYGENNLQLI